MKRIIPLLLGAALLVGCASTASNEVSTATQVAAKGEGKSRSDDKVCTVEKPLGSNMSRRVCRSKSEVEQTRKDVMSEGMRSGQ